MTTSLEILEECFERIYATRKNVLASKHKSSMKLEDKRKRGKLSTPSHKREFSPTRTSRTTNLADTLTKFQEDELENEPSPTKQPTTRNNHQLRTSAAPSSSSHRVQKNEDTLLNSTTTPKVIENHMDLTPNDLTATVVFDEFRTELMAWLSERKQSLLSPSNKSRNNKTQMQKELMDSCADCADYVTDKYLCQKLDPLHSSELVSKVRKTMSKIIEDFAMTAELPENFEDIRFYEIIGNADQDTHNSAYLKKLTKQLENDAAAASSSGGLRRGNSSLVSSIQMSGGGGGGGPDSLDTAVSGFGMNSLKTPKVLSKEEKEKVRIKEQYAQFMQKKPVVREVESTPSGIVSDMIGQNRDDMAASTAAVSSSSSVSFGDGIAGGGGVGGGDSTSGLSKTQGMTSNQALASKDTAKAKELEGLNDDIRTLLSSIQGKSLGEKLALTAPAVMNNNSNSQQSKK